MKCEHCGSDGDMGNSIQWMVKVTSVRNPSHFSAVTDMYIYPPVEGDLYFCDLGCLTDYIEAERQKVLQRYRMPK